MSPGAVTVRAPAKVNLQLAVGPLREDGYHDVASVFQAVSVVDDLIATPAPPGSGIAVEVDGPGASGVPTDGDNLAVLAAAALADAAGVRPDVRLRIIKSIPLAGGMAGGSADAAAALVACDALWGLGLDRGRLLDLARTLGADVSFALTGGTAVGLERGDRLAPALSRGRFEWIFALADGGLSTPVVYAELDRLRGAEPVAQPEVSDLVLRAVNVGDPDLLGDALSNDLQAAAISLRPELATTLEVGLDGGALGAVVSGSGPTCAFLARDEEHALDIAVALGAAGVCRAVRRAFGPVAGAAVVG